MLEVHYKTVKQIRGDTGTILFKPTLLDGTALTDYTATLSLKKSIDDTAYVFQKEAEVTSDGARFRISADDTANLDAGKYVYDIEIHQGDNVQTFGPENWYIIADVTRQVKSSD